MTTLGFCRFSVECDINQDTPIDDEINKLLVESMASVSVQTFSHKANFLGMADAVAHTKAIHQALKGFGLG